MLLQSLRVKVSDNVNKCLHKRKDDDDDLLNKVKKENCKSKVQQKLFIQLNGTLLGMKTAQFERERL